MKKGRAKLHCSPNQNFAFWPIIFLLKSNKDCTGKKNRFFKVFKVAGKKCITTVKQKIKKKTLRRCANDHGEFQQQSPQRLVDEYEYMNTRSDR